MGDTCIFMSPGPIEGGVAYHGNNRSDESKSSTVEQYIEYIHNSDS